MRSSSLSLHELHYNLGHVLEQQGDLAGAVQSYRQAIELQPTEARAYNNLGCVLAKQGEFAEAIQVYQRAIELQPDWALPYSNLGQVLTQQGNDRATVSAAITAYRRAIHLQPDLRLAHYHLGKLLCQQGQHATAVEHFQQAIEQNPTDWAAHADAAFAWIALGQLDRAFQLLQPVIQAQQPFAQAYWEWTEHLSDRASHLPTPSTQPPLDEFTQARFACGRFLWALHQQQPPDIISKHLADIYLHWANALTIYGGKGQYQQAQIYYRQVLQLQPDRLDASLGLADCHADSPPHGPISDTSTQDWIHTHPATADYRCLEWVRSNSASTIPVSQIPRFQPLPPSSCHGLNCQPCLKRLFDSVQFTHLGNGIHRCTQSQPVAIDSSPLFVIAIPQGKSWATPQQNDWLVCNAIAVFTPDDQLLVDLSRSYPGQLPGCQHPNSSQPQLPVNTLPAPTSLSGTVAVLSGLSGHNYYHWMVDILPRFALLHQSGIDLDQIDWFFINNTNQSFQRATLKALGIPLEKIVVSDRHPHIQADRLLVPSFAGPLGWVESWATDWLRQQFLPLANPIAATSNLPERIYISRAQANHRRVLNETTVVEQLQAFNFTPIQLETLSVAEQVCLFAHAKIILAPHGGGLTNLLFCRPGTIVIELVSPHYIRHYYWIISQQRSLQHYLIKGEPFVGQPLRQLMYPNPLLEDIWLNIDSLIEFLQTLREQ